jgi:ubiquinone/menaquinone biosynthesis C-methylase UbiE
MPGLHLKILHRAGLLRLYYWLCRPNFDGAHSRLWWETRDQTGSSAEAYWANRIHVSRDIIAQQVAALPGDSILEVGCHAGPTLWAIGQRKRFRRMAGTELSPTILDFTRAHLPAELNTEVELVQASADRLPFPDKSFDVVVTGALLACIGPERIMPSLAEMLRVCRGHLVLGEIHTDHPRLATPKGRKERYPNTSYWIRNYAGLLKNRAALVHVEHFTPEQKQGQGHIDSVMVFKVSAPPQS